jgi:hypothetical protein
MPVSATLKVTVRSVDGRAVTTDVDCAGTKTGRQKDRRVNKYFFIVRNGFATDTKLIDKVDSDRHKSFK